MIVTAESQICHNALPFPYPIPIPKEDEYLPPYPPSWGEDWRRRYTSPFMEIKSERECVF